MLVLLHDDEGAVELFADLASRRPETSVSCSSRMLIVSPTCGRSCRLIFWPWAALTPRPEIAIATIALRQPGIRIRRDRSPVRSERGSTPDAAPMAPRSDGVGPGRTSGRRWGA